MEDLISRQAVTQWKRNTALDMAIEALSCSEIPNNSDIISRQAAIDAVIKRDANCGIDSAEVLKTLPSAQPERIKGHWIAITSWNNTYKCSVCGRLLINITDGKNKVAKNYPYCHCGADMRGDKHETD